MPHITLGADYFRKERDNAYSDWGGAFWRENFQNSIDAGTPRINITLVNPLTGEQTTEVGSLERVLVTFADNGGGMTREVLENVFFRLGETTKNDSDCTNVGGFGRARLMTHFAQNSYTIHTGRLLVKGAGDHYDILDADTYHRGCLMTFDVNTKGRWDRIDLYSRLTQYLAHCQLDCDVTINGERWTNWCYRRSVTRSLSFATLHVNKQAAKDADCGRLLVRVNGVLMYRRTITPKVQIVLEIDPAKSREVLNSNRDGLHNGPSNELDDYINLLSSETKTALREEGNVITNVKGSGHFVHNKKDANVTVSNRQNPAIAAKHSVLPSREHQTRLNDGVPPTYEPNDNPYDQSSPERPAYDDALGEALGVGEALDQFDAECGRAVAAGQPLPTPSSFAVRKPAPTPAPETKAEKAIRLTQRQRERLFDLLINDNTASLDEDDAKRAVRKVIASYNPENWAVVHREGQGFTFTGGKKAKLLLVWKAILHHVVLEALELFGEDRYEWGVGWYFGAGEAEHHKLGDVRYVLLNPVDEAGKMCWGLRDKADLQLLIADAIHEVTHFKFSRHDEEFASAQTDLTARVLGRLPDIARDIRRIGQIKMV